MLPAVCFCPILFKKKILGLLLFWTGTVKTDRKVKEDMQQRTGSQTPTWAGCSQSFGI